ncbi:MAG TPA: alpha/beta hydrolase [SAR86 cluster bacterium]|nr:alpha/beta hydrolase [SAR86 cluster bacterium]
MERKIFTNKRGENFSYLSNEKEQNKINFVFFHATGFNAQTYEILLKVLGDKSNLEINLYALDQRGHGFSQAEAIPSELNSWSDFLVDGLDFIDSLSGRVVCSGHSMGSVIAAKIASIRKDRVEKLFMIEPVLYSYWESLKFSLLSRMRINRRLDIAAGAAKRRREFDSTEHAFNSYKGRGAFITWEDEWISNYLLGGTEETENGGIQLTCAPQWESATFRASSMDTWKYLKKIQIPCQVVYGEASHTFSPKARKEILRLGDNWQSKCYEDATHFLPMEKPGPVSDDIVRFING